MRIEKMTVTATRLLEWDSAHRVLRHESKCATLHGHRYRAEIECEAPKLDDVGRVVDFGVVKEVVGAWIDENWDHTTLVNQRDTRLCEFTVDEHAAGKRAPYIFVGEPTAENIAKELADVAQKLLHKKNAALTVRRVRVYETPNCYAEIVFT